MNHMEKCNCKCHENRIVIYCSKCVYFHKFGTEESKINHQPLWKKEYSKQYYIKKHL